MNSKSARLLMCGSALVSLMAGAAAAAPASDSGVTAGSSAPAAANASQVETVIVTADKREQRLQDVPASVSALSGKTLEARGVTDVQSLGLRVPNLRFNDSAGGNEPQVAMRGLSGQNVTPGGDSPVTFSVDGVGMSRMNQLDPEMFDVNRIEVLRGPQGTLYGRNSAGGSINIITNRPVDAYAGHVDALIGNYNARVFRGWANTPLYDQGDTQILFRFSAVSANHDAFQKNLSTAPTATYDQGAQRYDMERAQLLFKFDSVRLLLEASRSSDNAPPASKVQFLEEPGGDARFAGQTFYSSPWLVKHDYGDTRKKDGSLLAATLDWDFGWATLTSVTAGTQETSFQRTDLDGTDLPMATEDLRTKSTQVSQEVRLTSNDPSSALKWIAGAYAYHEDALMIFKYTDTGLNALSPTVGLTNSIPDARYHTTSWAVFGQADYDFAKMSWGVPLTASLGLRYTDDAKHGTQIEIITIPGLATPANPTGSVTAKPLTIFTTASQAVTGRFALNYKVSDNINAYASVSRGYLSGGFLINTYLPETLWSYEAGVKARLFDGRLQLNSSVFYQDIRQLQLFVQDGQGTHVINAGAARVDGLEAEATAIPIDNLKLNAEFALTDAVYTQFSSFNARISGFHPPANAGLHNWAGHKLNYTPPWTVDFGAEYAIHTNAGTLTPRIDWFWSGGVFFNYANAKPFDYQPAYQIVNLSLGFTPPSGRWSVDLFVKNLTNAVVISNSQLQSGSIGNGGHGGYQFDNYTYYDPRTFGVRFGANF